MNETRTTCPYCGVGCGVVARVEGDKVTVRGDEHHPASFGRLCVKGAALGETTGLQGRLLHPVVDGLEVDWPQALSAAGERLRAIIDTGAAGGGVLRLRPATHRGLLRCQ